MKVSVYLNEAQDWMFLEFRGDRSALRKAAEFDLDMERGDQQVPFPALYRVYEQLNVGGDVVPAEDYTMQYREAANRSLSVGDVVVIDGQPFSCRSVGWTEELPLAVEKSVERYEANPDTERLTSLPYVWTDGGYIDSRATEEARRGMGW